MQTAPVITVFGSSQPAPSSPAYQTAYALGRAIANAGWTLCNGGYGGTMAAGAQGAAEAGGHTIGVTCRIFAGRAEPNPFIRQDVPTFDLLARLNTLIQLGRGFVVLPGGTGTLVELALVWELFNKRLARPTGAVVLLGSFWQPVLDTIYLEQPNAVRPYVVATVEEAINVLRVGLADDYPPAPA